MADASVAGRRLREKREASTKATPGTACTAVTIGER